MAAIGRIVRELPHQRIAWRADSRIHIRLQGVAHEHDPSFAHAVESGLEQYPGVRWAAVNAPLGVVVVAYDGEVAEADLVGVVERIEREHSTQRERPADRPAAVDRVPGMVTALTAGAAGLAAAGVGRALRTVRLPAELGSLVQFVDTQPRLRGAVERVVGSDAADVLLAVSNALAQSAAQGLGGLALDLGQRAGQLAEAVLERDAWARSEPVLCGTPEAAAASPVTPERPAPLPPSHVERYSERSGLGAVVAFGGVLAVSADPRRAAGVALAALPKPARLGREGCAAALGCLLARRGAVIVDHRALRLLDRIDTIVVDAGVLTATELVVERVVTAADADPDHVTGVVHALFCATEVDRVRTDGSYMLGPLDGLGVDADNSAALAAELAGCRATYVLGLAAGSRLHAVVAVAPERAAAADLVIAAASQADTTFLLASDEGDQDIQVPDAGLQAEGLLRTAGVLPGGRRLVASVRGLQAAGGCVLLVSSQRRALAAADVGIGLASADGRPPWGAHILAGSDLALAALAIDAVPVARAASERGVQLAQAAAALGSALAFGGSPRGAAGRSLLAVNGAAAIALVSGAWSITDLARRPHAAGEPTPPWHEMPADVVLDRLGTAGGGLSAQAAQRRWRPDGRQPRPPTLPRAFAAELVNPLTPILAGGAALSASIGAVADAIIVSAVCALSALMGGVQRVHTERSMARLLAASAVTATVVRDGTEQTMPAVALVTGDVVVLAAGDVVPADCRLLDARALQVDESSLTGESFPVDKTTDPVTADAIADRRCMLYEGTTIAAGRARAVVVATGSATEMGRSLMALSTAAPATGVEARMTQITRTTLPLALGSAAAVVAAGLLRGRRARDTIGAAVGLAVASVPEGLPFLVTAAQLASARRLADRGALVRNPRTIEALGRVNVLCFDKTGTLTQGRMAVAAISDGARTRRSGAFGPTHQRVLAAALRATPRPRSGRRAEHLTDQAVSDGAAAQHVTRSDGYGRWRRIDALPFEPSRGYHATLAGTQDGPLLSVKGAPEVVLPRCTRWRGHSMKASDRKRLGAQLDRLAEDGYRVLAVAENHVAAGYTLAQEVAELSFAGFVAFGDPVRVTAGVSVRELRDAGVHVVMITGDHPATATAIATELDVLNGGTVVTGPDLDRLDDAALSRTLADATVIARCTPEHKVRVVRALQSAGRVVAMTGDGANDAAAIRLADVGIALGRRGTPAARAAADLVVSDDRLETIIAAVVEGRAMWRSVRQAIGILVGGNIGEIGYTLLGTLMTGTSPLSARQLLLVNLLTDLVPALTVALRPPTQTPGSLLAEGPDSSLGSALTEEITTRAIATGAAGSAAWLVARATGSRARARTVGLAAVISAELGQTLLVGGRSPAVIGACLGSLGVLVAVVQTPGVSQFFGCVPIGPVGWTLAAGSAAAATAGSVLAPRLGRAVAPAVQSVTTSAAAEQAGSVLADIRAWAAQVLPAGSDEMQRAGRERQETAAPAG